MPHILDDRVRAADPQILFAATVEPAPPDVLIQPETSADNRANPRNGPAIFQAMPLVVVTVDISPFSFNAMQLMVPCGGLHAISPGPGDSVVIGVGKCFFNSPFSSEEVHDARTPNWYARF